MADVISVGGSSNCCSTKWSPLVPRTFTTRNTPTRGTTRHKCHMYMGVMAQVISHHKHSFALIQFSTTTVQDKSQRYVVGRVGTGRAQAQLARWRKQQQGAQEQLQLLPKSAQRRSGLEACGQSKRVSHESLE